MKKKLAFPICATLAFGEFAVPRLGRKKFRHTLAVHRLLQRQHALVNPHAATAVLVVGFSDACSVTGQAAAATQSSVPPSPRKRGRGRAAPHAIALPACPGRAGEGPRLDRS